MNAPVVIKIGGAVLNDLSSFWKQLKAMDSPLVIVHGGGIQSTRLARQLGHTPTIIQGRRVTGDLDLQIAEWTLRGAVNTHIVAEANIHGLKAVGFSGVDGAMIKVRKREPWQIEGGEINFGWVGEIISIDTTLINITSELGWTSVIAPLGMDHSGQRFNVNADTVACELAGCLGAKELLLVTDAGGVLRNLSDPTSRLPICSAADQKEGIEQGWIKGGMSVKLHTARKALARGVSSVWILRADDLLHRKNATSIIM